MSHDRDLLHSISLTLAESARRAGDWLACRPGCHQCCLGPFPIGHSDAGRLRAGLLDLDSKDPGRAARIRERALAYTASIGALDEDGLPEGMDDVPCPVLDPESGHCDLYEFRPVTCRTFGPAVRSGDAIGACELCYVGATEAEIEACAVEFDVPEEPAETIVAAAVSEAFRRTARSGQ